ncbi:hypothetical protein ACIBTP_28930 [Streptomyces avidinii]|uniref:hypothetical protein n=1 Tax=Streptomyces avidinii TaxID=1895 RepID=UPI0037ADFBBC
MDVRTSMTDSGIPRTPPLLLTDAIHQAIKPGTALLRLETPRSREGLLDGARWTRTTLITRGHNDHFALLVVPPDTTADAAREAMARAVRADNITQAAQILIATTPDTTDASPGPAATTAEGAPRHTEYRAPAGRRPSFIYDNRYIGSAG